MSAVRKVAVLGGARIPFCRSGTHYKEQSNFDLLSTALKGLVEKFRLRGERLGDVSMGAILKHSSDWNLARECVLEAGLSPATPAFDLQRACGTSLNDGAAAGSA